MPAWTGALAVVLYASCVVVPCLFVTRLDESFVLPKLVVLWIALTLGLLVAAGSVLLSSGPGSHLRVLPLDLAVSLFVVLQVVAFLASTDHAQSLQGERFQRQGLLTMLLYVGFYALARVSLGDLRRMTLLFLSVTVGATLVSAYAVVQWVGIDPIWDELPDGRVASSIGQTNALAAYLVLAVPLAVILLLRARGALRLAYLAVAALLVLAVFITESRGGYLGLVAATVVLLVGLWRELGARARRVAAVGAAATLAAGIGAFAVAEPDRLASSWDFGANSSTRVHLDLWTVAAHVATENPLLGTGQETFPDQLPRYGSDALSPERAAYFDDFRVESPHNVYLGVAAGAGFPALAAYLAVIGAFAHAVVTGMRTAGPPLRLLLVGALAAAAGHLATDFFVSPDLTGSWLFWMLMGATATVAGAARG